MNRCLFDLDDALLCAHAARAAYGAVRGQELDRCMGVVEDVSDYGGACLINGWRGRILAFRGTSSVAEWLEDGDALLKINEQGAGSLHEGFARHFAGMWPWLKKIRAPRWITGHSLGGAMAVIAGQAFPEWNAKPTYTFGAPRVGNRDFVAGCTVPHWRVVNDLDPVPRLPWDLHYRHAGSPVFLREGQLSFGLSVWGTVAALASRLKYGLLTTIELELHEHRIESYIAALDAVRVPDWESDVA
jgi:Lipase (class 3)